MEASLREDLLVTLRRFFPRRQLLENVNMSRYTTLKLGGEADVVAEIATVDQLAAALTTASALRVPVTIIGNGSNILVLDGGIRGLVIHIGELMSEISDPEPQEDGSFLLTAQAGATLQKLCNSAARESLSGLEFASGIPGTIGGAVYMNAGAYGGEMKDVVVRVECLSSDGVPVIYSAEEMEFSYRKSSLGENGAIVTAVTFRLMPGDEETIRATMREFSARRREKQPAELPSCGSTFKRPEGNFAGTLIEQCGLKGARIGGAGVSTKHAGFLVNDEAGTAADYLALIRYVQETVREKTGILLEPEVRILGDNKSE